MRIKMLTAAAGPDFSAQPGMIVNVALSRAETLIRGGFAVQVDPDPEPVAVPVPETASIEVPEKAVQPKPTKKAGGKRGT